MKDKKEFYNLLTRLDGQPYAEYQQMVGDYDFARYVIKCGKIDFDADEVISPLFTIRVPQTIAEIPYGEVMSYKEIAETIGRPRAYRAVANACGKNFLLVVVPCHRVVGSGPVRNGKPTFTLGGYSSGLDKKRWLMKLERIDL